MAILDIVSNVAAFKPTIATRGLGSCDAEALDLMRIFALKYLTMTVRHVCKCPVSLRSVKRVIDSILIMDVARQIPMLTTYLSELEFKILDRRV
jgi:hypothetical protein